MTKPTEVRIFSDARALESERHSDFDIYSSFGEVIDNSIQAEATKIRIEFKNHTQAGKRKARLASVAFGDDGHGMDKTVLHNCLALGYSSRYNNRDGIGRFGVGMTKGAISQCRRIEVYSKTKSADGWLYTVFDIDTVVKTGSATVPEPIKKAIPKEWAGLAGKDHGTLVVWSHFDQIDEPADTVEAESRIWIGRTFRKFIFKGVKFFLNNEEIKAIDPLYLNPEFTAFPSDPKAELIAEDKLEWIINDPSTGNLNGKKSTIIIRHSILPEEFRAKGGGRGVAGGHEDNRLRCIDRNEGISILRNGREVREPDNLIPSWSPRFKDTDRWWGCEIEFSAELDHEFKVKNIKRGAIPRTELREKLQEKINHTRKSIEGDVSHHWNSLKIKLPNDPIIETDLTHGESEKIVDTMVKEVKPIDKRAKGKDTEKEITKYVESLTHEPERRKAFIKHFRESLITIKERPARNFHLFEVHHFGSGKKVIDYNSNHPFMNRYLEILGKLESGDDANLTRAELTVLIDLLIVGYSLAEATFEPEQKMRAEDFLETLSLNWGVHLKQLMTTWRETTGD